MSNDKKPTPLPPKVETPRHIPTVQRDEWKGSVPRMENPPPPPVKKDT